MERGYEREEKSEVMGVKKGSAALQRYKPIPSKNENENENNTWR